MNDTIKERALYILGLIVVIIMFIFVLNAMGCFSEKVETYDFHATVIGINKTEQNDYRIQFVDGDEIGSAYIKTLKAVRLNGIVLIHATITEDLFGMQKTYYRIGN